MCRKVILCLDCYSTGVLHTQNSKVCSRGDAMMASPSDPVSHSAHMAFTNPDCVLPINSPLNTMPETNSTHRWPAHEQRLHSRTEPIQPRHSSLWYHDIAKYFGSCRLRWSASIPITIFVPGSASTLEMKDSELFEWVQTNDACLFVIWTNIILFCNDGHLLRSFESCELNDPFEANEWRLRLRTAWCYSLDSNFAEWTTRRRQ